MHSTSFVLANVAMLTGMLTFAAAEPLNPWEEMNQGWRPWPSTTIGATSSSMSSSSSMTSSMSMSTAMSTATSTSSSSTTVSVLPITTTTTVSTTASTTASTTSSTTTSSTPNFACPSYTPFVIQGFGNANIADGSVVALDNVAGGSSTLLDFTSIDFSGFYLDADCALVNFQGQLANIDSDAAGSIVYFNSQADITQNGYEKCVCNIALAPNPNALACACGTANIFSLTSATEVYISTGVIPTENAGVYLQALFAV